MTVRDLYQPGVFAVEGAETLSGVAQQMLSHDIGSVAVLEDGALAGMITERDLVTALAGDFDPHSTTASVAMTHSVATVSLDDEWSKAARRMLDLGIRHLPVINDGKVVGMISIRDLMAAVVWE